MFPRLVVMTSKSVEREWYLVSSHGSVLFFVAAHPDCTIKEISGEMSLTQRSVWGTVGDLRRAGMLSVRRHGHRHHYTVNLAAPFRHPTIAGITLSQVIGKIVAKNGAVGVTPTPRVGRL